MKILGLILLLSSMAVSAAPAGSVNPAAKDKPVQKTIVRDAQGKLLQASAPTYTLIGSGLWFYTTQSCPVHFTPVLWANSDLGQSYFTQGWATLACFRPTDLFANYTVFYPNHLRGYIAISGDFGFFRFYAQNAPTATISGSTSGVTGQSLSFNGGGTVDAQYSKDKTLTYQWTFGNGASATGQNVSYAYPNSGNYVVTLKTFDGTYYSQAVTLNVSVSGANTGLGVPQLSAYFDPEVCEKDISWTAIQGATSYRLERQTSTTWSEIANTGDQYFIDAGPGARSYRVKACNSSACGEFSNVVRAGSRCFIGTDPR